jgi:dipeptidyl aminopeptidase/acylaminoacyl peptidase
LAFYKIDETKVASYPLVTIKDPIASVRKIRYPMAGRKSQQVEIGIFNFDKKELLWLQPPDEKDAYLTCVTWSPDEKAIYLAEVNRTQKICQVKRYSSSTGSLDSILFLEKDEKYIEPQHPLFFIDNNPDLFVWQSRRDGFNHLYLYNRDGHLIRQLTQGAWEVTELTGYHTVSRQILFTSTILSPLNRNSSAVNIDTGECTLLTPENGTHLVVLSSENDLFIDHFHSTEVPGKVFKRSLSDNRTVTLLHDAPNPYDQYCMPETEIGTIQQDNNSPELYYRIVQPPEIDRRKKYPLLFYVYGGPHVQLIRNEWLAGTKGLEYLMAQAGYVVFSIDPRGSANRGKKFEEVIWRDIGKYQL